MQLAKLDKKLTVSKQAAATFSEIDGMAKKTIGGNMQLTPADWDSITNLAKEGVMARGDAANLRRQLTEAKKEIRNLKTAFDRFFAETGLFREAVKLAPKRARDALEDVVRQQREQNQTGRSAKRKNKDMEH